MRKNCILACIFISVLLLCGCSGQRVSTEKGTQILGEFVTVDLIGTPVNQEIFSRCKLTMVNIWATYCNPCVREMPDFAQLKAHYGEAFQVIGIIADAADQNANALPEIKAKARSIIETTGADYLHLLPSASLQRNYLHQVQAVPETFFVDAAGNQVGEHYWGAKTKEEWMKIIDALLDGLSD